MKLDVKTSASLLGGVAFRLQFVVLELRLRKNLERTGLLKLLNQLMRRSSRLIAKEDTVKDQLNLEREREGSDGAISIGGEYLVVPGEPRNGVRAVDSLVPPIVL